MAKSAIIWLRNDLRCEDNPALHQAINEHDHVYPIYILDNSEENDWTIGSAKKVWLHYSLKALKSTFDDNFSVYIGSPASIIDEVIKKTGSTAIYWNRCYDPYSIKRDSLIKSSLKDIGIEVNTFNASLLWEPWEVLKKDKTPYKVFTPYYRKGCLNTRPPQAPLPKPELKHLKRLNGTKMISDLNLLPKVPWHRGIEETWNISENGALNALNTFLDHGVHDYKEGRNFPNKQNVSRLSPYLQSGEISPRTVWHSAQERLIANDIPESDTDHFLSELGWREFSHNILYHFPDLPKSPLQKRFENFPWEDNSKHLQAWQTGKTGYPIVDAGMRELWQTGYMHNRVRMIVGSFLVKHLLIHWHHGEEWFWDCLVDADLANNSASWQWIAGCGADAAPYFRIFNPITQGEKFDPSGEYIRKYVPELNALPDKYLNKPWEAPPLILEGANIKLGHTYPNPIIEHSFARQRALEAFQSTKT